MKIAYGPPGAVGVKSLQYVGDDADYRSSGSLKELTKPVGAIAIAVYLYAWHDGDQKLQRQAQAVAAGAILLGWAIK